MEALSALLAFLRGIPVDLPHKGPVMRAFNSLRPSDAYMRR